jgi:hypothetical protein
MGERIGGVFDQDKQALVEHLSHAPQAPENELPPSRWNLSRIRQSCPFLEQYSLPGVSLFLKAAGIRLRQGRHQYYSPDPAYGQKVKRLLSVLEQVACSQGREVALFVDEMGFLRWPEPSRDWCQAAPHPRPLADRKLSPAGQWRLIGSLDALSGRVLTLDNSIVGRRQVGAFLTQIDQSYPDAQKIFVIWDNWSIHQHEEVLAELSRLQVVCLPTYAPWLNPIEKLWRKLRQEVLYLHRYAYDWKTFRERVRAFFAQFATGSDDLLCYVGLRGDGQLATALRST